jgi:hypothetical protein
MVYALRSTSTTTNTRASEEPTPIAGIENSLSAEATLIVQDSPFKDISQYPTSYRDTPIPASLFDQGKEKYAFVEDKDKLQTYLIDRVLKYYIYQDVLRENDLLEETPQENISYTSMEGLVESYEDLVKSEVLTNMDFVYLYVWYDSPTREEVEEKINGDAKNFAHSMLLSYKDRFASESSPSAVIEASHKEDNIVLLNNYDHGERSIEDYTKGDNFLLDINLGDDSTQFNKFLFDQTVEEVSEIYQIGGVYENGEVIETEEGTGFIIVYPTSVHEGSYETFDDLLIEYSNNIEY